MGRFDDRVALVTGAASGIGRAVCRRLTSEGGRVFGMDIDGAGLAETASLVKDAGGEMQTGIFDVTRREQCIEAVKETVDAFGKLDILANVAGIVRFHHFPDWTEEDWDLVHDVNLKGPFFMSQAAIPHLLESGGNIVNVASNAALMGQAYTAAYCSSKGALVQLTRSIAMEYLKQGIRVNAVAPAGVTTPLTQGIDFPENLDHGLMKRYMSVRGMSDPEEIAAAIAFIASDEAKSIHGAVLSIDNGLTIG